MAKRRFVIHIGLHHAGGAALATGLAEQAPALAEVGVRVPARSPEESMRAALEIRRLHKSRGYQRKEVEGSWALLCKRARKEGVKTQDAVVVSDDRFAGASTDEIALLLDSLAGFEVHVVAVLADPARQLVGAWSEAVRGGESLSLRRYARRVLDADRRLDEAQAFWAEQDVEQVLGRWSHELRRADRVHVVVPGHDEDPTAAAWNVVARLVGADATAVDLHADPLPDPTSLAVLRGVNRSVDGRADRRTQRLVVEERLLPLPLADALDEGELPEPSHLLPAELHEELCEVGEAWAKAVAEGGYAVTGDTSLLIPPAPAARPPVEPTLEQRLSTTTDALADLLVEVSRMRERTEELEKRNAKLEKKKAKLRTRLAAALAEG